MPALSAQTLTDLLAPDTQDMVKLVRMAPERGKACLAIGRQQPFAPSRELTGILVCGMGGSGSTGDMLRAICAESRLPISVCKSPHLPAWVGPGTLVIAVSYSGNTYETLGSLRQAIQQGAQILALGSGGELAKLAQEHDFPLLKIEGGLPPRAALFDLLFALLGSLESLAALGLQAADIDAILADLELLSQTWSLEPDMNEPLPLLLARDLATAEQVLLWGVSDQTENVAVRWKNQLSENAKTLASVSVLPELNHNEIVALCHPFGQAAGSDADMCARHHSRSSLIYFTLESVIPASEAVVLDLARPFLKQVEPLMPPAGSRLHRLLYLVYLGDVCSVYLALLKGVNPTPIAAIDELKRRMA